MTHGTHVELVTVNSNFTLMRVHSDVVMCNNALIFVWLGEYHIDSWFMLKKKESKQPHAGNIFQNNHILVFNF